MNQKKAVWIWYPGDFEIYHGMLQNFQREERGYGWPAYWKMDDWRKNVHFYRKYDLKEAASFSVKGIGQGYVSVNGKKYPFETEITCEAGEQLIEVFVGHMTGLACCYVQGDVIFSDAGWMADDFEKEEPVGTSSLYEELEPEPNEIHYEEELCEPKTIKELENGLLMDFGRVINGTLKLHFSDCEKRITICYGESMEEAADETWCYYKQEQVGEDTYLRRRAFRFLYMPGCKKADLTCEGIHQYVPIAVKAGFHCEDEMLNQIWEVSEETYKLCSGLFFIDGIKRDRWIWSGDAYQSYFVNPYLFFDEEINKRTMLALRGNLGIEQHINTILDYSLLWIIAVEKEYWMDKNKDFVKMIYPKMVDLMNLFERQLDKEGFIYGREKDWIFVDWSDIDKEGTISAEQLLLLKCYQTMGFCGNLIGENTEKYQNAFTRLKQQIFRYFWDEEKGAFIDSYQSGKRHVTRHANIFALLFDLVDDVQRESIIRNVILNPEITQITTPYFKFFELDVLGKNGYLKEVMEQMKDYWGGMIKKGATTFWEEYIPGQDGVEQYGMYGDPFGKSLCHAWGASPIYLLGRYFLGICPLTPGYETFAVEPHLEFFRELDCEVPVKDGSVHVTYKDGKLNVTSSRKGGYLIVDGKKMELL